MLARPFRLHRQRDIERVLRYGRGFTTPYFRFKVAANNLSHTRATVVASAKVSKRAVIRNRLKRQTREIIRLNFANLPASKDILIMVQPSAKDATYAQMEKTVLYAIKLLESQGSGRSSTTYPRRIHSSATLRTSQKKPTISHSKNGKI